MSETLEPDSSRDVKFVKPDRGEMSETLVRNSRRDVKFVKPDRGEMSVKLPDRSSVVRFVAFSNPVRSRTESGRHAPPASV